MFSLIGERTRFERYNTFDIQNTIVIGDENGRTAEYRVDTQIPKCAYNQAGIRISTKDKGTQRVVSRVDFSLGEEGPYKNVTIQDLLNAHSHCLEELRGGTVVNGSRLVAMLTGKDELEVRAQTEAKE